MQLLYAYVRRYWRVVALALGLAAINQVCQLMDPLIARKLVDDYASRYREYTPAQFLQGVSLLILAVVALAIGARMARAFQEYFVRVVTERVGADLYSDGLRRCLEAPYASLEDQSSGETLGKLQKVRTDVQKLLTIAINTLFTTLVGVTFVTVYAFTVHWIVAPVFFVTVPLLAYLIAPLSRRIKSMQKTIVAETTALAGSTTESLRNVELVRSLGLSRQEIERLQSITDRIVRLELRKVRGLRMLSFFQATLVVALQTSITFLMVFLIYAEEVSLGQWFSLWLYSFYLFAPLQELGTVVSTFREAEASLDNFKEILAAPVEARPAQPSPLGPLRSLAFEDVTFGYRAAATPALVGVSFQASCGQTVAFVGPSGSGKTTLVKLLVGLYAPQRGCILYNDQPVTKVDLDELRTQIGLVTQDTQLFSGSIRDNLLFARPGATDAECLAVLRQAACESLLARADRGLDTVIGEAGIKISGGERQRLSIARALLRRPRLLVFDEATSALDSLTEEEVSATVRELASRDVMTILIAHRLSTVFHADAIHVLERGSVVESGQHAALLERKGLYYAMWRQQVGEPLPDREVRRSPPVRITAGDAVRAAGG